MKKFLVILITLLCFFPINVFASGSISVNRGSLSIAKGSSSSFVVSANNAAGRVDIYSSNSSVAKVSTSSSWLDNNSVTVTVTGVNDGNATIIVKITDAATYDEEALSGTRSVSVNVYSNTSSNNVSNNNSQNSNQSKPSNSSKYNNSSNTKKNEPIKNDATLSSLNVKNYDIGFDKNKEEYNIEIENYINSLDIDAKANMSTSKVNIEGNKDLKVGDNTINVIVTSEDGTKKTYKINVKRKDEVVETTIDKINEVIDGTTKDTVKIKIIDNLKISKDIIDKINSSKKNIIINKYDNDMIVYSWNFKSGNMNFKKEFDSNISFSDKDLESLRKKNNYSEMYKVIFGYNGDISDSIIKLNVSGKFNNNDKVNIYKYDKESNSFILIKNDIVVKDDMIEFNINKAEDLILSKSKLDNKSINEFCSSIKKPFNYFIIISIVELLIIFVLIYYFLFYKKIRKQDIVTNDVKKRNNKKVIKTKNNKIKNQAKK